MSPMTMTVSEIKKMLDRDYEARTELVVAWWDAEWFGEQLKDELGWLNPDEVDICMRVADKAVEFSNLADSIVSACAYEVEKARLEGSVAKMKKSRAEFARKKKQRLARNKKRRLAYAKKKGKGRK